MKRILFFLVLAFVVFGTNAQNAHLKFMGIPLDGKISAFNKELKKKGFMLDEFAGKKLKALTSTMASLLEKELRCLLVMMIKRRLCIKLW